MLNDLRVKGHYRVKTEQNSVMSCEFKICSILQLRKSDSVKHN